MRKRTWFILSTLLIVSTSAFATPPKTELLRQRVTQELQSDGVSLAQLGYALEVTNDKHGVRIRLLATGNGMVLSTKYIATLPEGNDAAIAHLTMAVASMVQALESNNAITSRDIQFDADAVISYHRPKTVLVIGAGPQSPALEGAVLSLKDAYRQSGTPVASGKTIPKNLSTFDDAAIVKNTNDTQAATIAILRVFQGAAEQNVLRAVVTLYDKQGQLITAFTVSSGQAMSEAKAHEDIDQGVSTQVVEEVLRTRSSQEEAQKTYEEQYVKLNEASTIDFLGVAPIGYRGKYKEPLTGVAFYKAVGRKDLADAFKNRIERRRSRRVLGGVILAGTLVASVAYPFIFGHDGCYDCNPVIEDNRVETLLPALGIAFGGAIVGWTVFFSGGVRPLVNPSEARRLADEHNTKLRKELGLMGQAGRPKAKSKTQLTWFPYASQNGGGMVFGARF